MSNASRRPSSPGTSGISRANLRSAPARPTREREPEAAPRPQPAVALRPPPSLWRESMEVVVSVCAVLAGLVALLAMG
ncbi:MAG: hypothetical protein ABW005_09185, partial [Burkholderiaceae bacterium]